MRLPPRRAAAQADFDTVKVKVGIGDDAGRLAAVRAAVGPRVAIRVDANGAWGIDEAVAALSSLAPAGIELAEEPVHGVEALRAVRAEVDVPLAMDETAAEEGAAGSGATDAVCLKIARCGGITGVLRDAAEARIAGSAVYLASTFDGPIGIAAAVHAAAGPDRGRAAARPRPRDARPVRRARRAPARGPRRDPRALRARALVSGRVAIARPPAA